MVTYSDFGLAEPSKKLRFMDLVKDAGIDISDWPKYASGNKPPAANPKFCYEWCLLSGDTGIINLWLDETELDRSGYFQRKNFKAAAKKETGPRKVRCLKADKALSEAHRRGIALNVALLERNLKSRSKVGRRALDSHRWAVVSYDATTGDLIIRRGVSADVLSLDDVSSSFREGEERLRYVRHRQRERGLRKLKIEEFQKTHNGRLFCEVPNCGFDFSDQYGELGDGYAQVHHLTPLASAPAEGVMTSLDDLAVVCANCHVMVHLGGECRDIKNLIPIVDVSAH